MKLIRKHASLVGLCLLVILTVAMMVYVANTIGFESTGKW